MGSKTARLDGMRKFHGIVKALESTGFGELFAKKCHTFGSAVLKQKIEQQFGDMETFKLVGGAFITEHATAKNCALEAEGIQTWAETVVRMRYSPSTPWRQKARILLATQKQATFGQGTHSLQCDVAVLKKIRSNIIGCLWSTSPTSRLHC